LAIIKNITRNTIISSKPKYAKSFVSRLKGLLGQKDFGEYDGLVIRRCKAIHTIGMKFFIDVIFYDRNFKVSEIYEKLKSNKIVFAKSSYGVIELPAGIINKTSTQKNDIIEFKTMVQSP
jgi:uncharacterized membrane protein (UPF0127 family)